MSRVDVQETSKDQPPADVDLQRVWSGIAGEVWARQPGPFERLIIRLGLPPVLGRVISATPSLLPSWLVATVIVFALGIGVTHSTDQPWIALLAPALTGASVAFAYGPGADPAFEVAQTTPVNERMILLARVVAVVSINALLGIAASLISSLALEITLAWLLPMAAVAGLSLAVAVGSGSSLAGAGIGQLLWMLVITASAYRTEDLTGALVTPGLQIAYLVILIGSLVGTIWLSDNMRWKRFDRWI